MRNEILGYQSFFDDDVQERIEHGHIGIGLELQRAPRMSTDVCHSRIGQHNLGATQCCVFHPGSRYGVIAGGVGADDENEVRMLHVPCRIANGT